MLFGSRAGSPAQRSIPYLDWTIWAAHRVNSIVYTDVPALARRCLCTGGRCTPEPPYGSDACPRAPARPRIAHLACALCRNRATCLFISVCVRFLHTHTDAPSDAALFSSARAGCVLSFGVCVVKCARPLRRRVISHKWTDTKIAYFMCAFGVARSCRLLACVASERATPAAAAAAAQQTNRSGPKIKHNKQTSSAYVGHSIAKICLAVVAAASGACDAA